MRFGRLLVPLDGSDAAHVAVDYAAIIPSRAVTLLSVVPDGAAELLVAGPGRRQEWKAALVARATAYLDEVAAELSRQGREIPLRVEHGDPAEQIIVAAADCDLIVMTTHGRGAGERALFGSVADRVVRHASVPVLLIRGGERPVRESPLTRVVVPLDGSPAAERALPVAMDLADDLGIRIHLVRAIDAASPRAVVRVGPAPASAYAAAVEEARSTATAYLEEQAKRVRARDISVTTEVREGAPAAELNALTRPGDIIVMTTHGRTGIGRWLLGSVTERVVREAPVPVLVVRARDESEASASAEQSDRTA